MTIYASMNICPDIEEFIRKLEMYAKRKLYYPMEVRKLLLIVIQKGLVDEFDGLIFQAKFLVRTQEIMKRIGPGMDGFEKLSTEFQSSMKKSIDFLNLLVEKAPSDIARKLTDMFVVKETDSFSRLMKLFSDLSCIKNWQVDGKPLPYETKPNIKSDLLYNVERKVRGEEPNLPLVRIQQSAWLGTLFVVLMLCVDPPVTVLGWCLSLGIAVFLVYIILQIYVLKRTPKL